ncbi:hypothetical protein SAMN04488239_108174 [Ruegeria marina]|uniref:Uncharacterized protein n=1 Tax=Ruegeria marina TaxID=639004 RepID=A0A1G6VW28_9RHOB|nr:hypothetical protein SAMN04488239_108174 [Ruegeria marina]
MIQGLPNIDPMHMHPVDAAKYQGSDDPGHPQQIPSPRGSVRARLYPRTVGCEAKRLLRLVGAEGGYCDPSGAQRTFR